MIQLYSRPSLSLLCLSRITAYLEVKSGPRFQHENFTTGYIILLKRGEIAPQDFLNILNTSLTSRLEAHIHLWKWLFDLFFISQFCKFDMSRYGYIKVFQTVIGPRDNESRLYSCLYHKIGALIWVATSENVPSDMFAKHSRSPLRKQAYSNILKNLPPKKWKFSDKNFDIFHISAQKHRLWVLVRTASPRRF